MMNLTHSVKQMLRFGEDMFDVGIIGHHHEAAAEFFDFHGEKKLAIRTGSYKIRDTYGRQEGYNNATPVFPFFILHPQRKDDTVFPSVEAGCDYLRFLRKGK